MNQENLASILKEFRVELASFVKSKDTALSEVYTINKSYILRGRIRASGDTFKIKKEIDLIERVRPLISLSLPIPIPSSMGNLFYETDTFLWTLYPIIPGEIICSWFNLELCPDEKLGEIMRLLKKIHTDTKGAFNKQEQNTFIEKDLREILIEVKPLLSPHATKRVESAFSIVTKRRSELQSEDLCFLHNDFHPGNIIFKEEKASGLIDLDWARIGDPLEDVSYSIMMLMRIYSQETFSFNKNRFELLTSSYGFERNEKEIFLEYLILFAMYEISVCKNLNLEKKDFYLSYQLSMLDVLTSDEFGKTISQSFDMTSTGSPS